MKIQSRLFTMVAVLIGTLSFSVFAQSDEASDIAAIRAELVKMIPVAQDAEITSTDVDGIYRLLVQGNYAYAYVDGDFALIGDLFNTKDKVNLGETAAAERMAGKIGELPTSKMIVYGPEKPKRYISVFTDIDCGYCRKLHLEIPQLNAAGIQVRYLAYPRAGIPSASYDKYQSVWCNDDRQTALTAAKAGETVASAECDNPIEETFNLGRNVGVRGTPTMIFDDGTVVPGYVEFNQLIERLGLSEG
ncbi:MAG: DsbC family protein [Acidiferrobacterales bacterium]|nr:DsbC family protein [Acidiferrobacterales bacterium]